MTRTPPAKKVQEISWKGPVIVIVGQGSPNVMAYTAAAVASGHAGSWSLALQVGFSAMCFGSWSVTRVWTMNVMSPSYSGSLLEEHVTYYSWWLKLAMYSGLHPFLNSSAIEKLAVLDTQYSDNGHEQNLAPATCLSDPFSSSCGRCR